MGFKNWLTYSTEVEILIRTATNGVGRIQTINVSIPNRFLKEQTYLGINGELDKVLKDISPYININPSDYFIVLAVFDQQTYTKFTIQELGCT